MRGALRPLAALGTGAFLLVTALLHGSAARARRDRESAAVSAVVRALPAFDLSLAGGARHLRFPSLEDPGAAFSDAPASADADPAGGAMAPPIEVYEGVAQVADRRR